MKLQGDSSSLHIVFKTSSMPAIPGNAVILLPTEAILCTYYAHHYMYYELNYAMFDQNACRYADHIQN